MKKLHCFILSIVFLFTIIFDTNVFFTSNVLADYKAQPEIFAEAGVLVDLSTGAVLYDKNKDNHMYPASITKIMTALLTIENCSMDEIMTFSHNSIYSLEFGDAHIGLKEGEQLSVIDTLHGLMLASANECANECGQFVAKKSKEYQDKISALQASNQEYDEYDVALEVFGNMMNERAKRAGAINTHFNNPSGLFSEEHYTTCYDMAMITRQVANNPIFLGIESDLTYTIPATNLTPETRAIGNRHKMLYPDNAKYYEGVLGGKTGYVDQSGNTLVTFARRNGTTLISVVMKSDAYHVYDDTRILLDYGFNTFHSINVNDYEKEYTKCPDILSFDRNAKIIIPNGVEYNDVQCTKDITSKRINLNYTYEGRDVGHTTYILNNNNHASFKSGAKIMSKNKDISKKSTKSNFVSVVLIIILSVVLIIALMIAIIILKFNIKNKRRRRNNRKRRKH